MQTSTVQPGQAVTDKLGRPLRDLRISVTDRCNWRCTYCMPAEVFGERYEFMPRSEVLTFEEIERLTRLFVGLGVTKLRITGGEPTVRADLPELIRLLSAIQGPDGPLDLTLTTNGYLLAKVAEQLRDAGLRRITVHLDSLDDATFRKMSGRPYGPERTLEGIAAAARAGLSPVKVNCVVQKGVNDHQLVDMARYFKGTGHILRFIEFMDVGTKNAWNLGQVVPAAEILRTVSAAFPLRPADPNYAGEVAERYLYEDGSGEIGIIASVSKPFCGDCTRARLTTDGRLVTCLFASTGLDLKGPMRAGATDDDLRQTILGVWGRRTDRYSELRSARTNADGTVRRSRKRIEMYQLGG
jgi:cyclic pyranopterin phosphate synthase